MYVVVVVNVLELVNGKDFSIEICGKYFIFRLPSELSPVVENTMLWICSACTGGWLVVVLTEGVNQLQDPFKMAGSVTM